MHTLEDMRFKTDLRAITGDLIESEYIRYMSDEVGVKHATIATTLRALRAFCNWAVSKGVIESSPMAQITIGVPKAPTIETFSREQLRAICSQPDPKSFVGLLDLTLMTLMVETGVRVRELCDIKVDDIRSEDNQILIAGKNGEDRHVPIQTQTKRLLKRYLQARGDSPVEWLFISHDDEQMKIGRASCRERVDE